MPLALPASAGPGVRVGGSLPPAIRSARALAAVIKECASALCAAHKMTRLPGPLESHVQWFCLVKPFEASEAKCVVQNKQLARTHLHGADELDCFALLPAAAHVVL
jgi:hypothetical protein